MSKASEYQDRIRAARDFPPPFKIEERYDGHKTTLAWLGDSAELRIVSGGIPIEEIPAFIAWLQDTFLD